jgi:hypothetical protein
MIYPKDLVEYLCEGNNKEDLAELYLSKLSPEELEALKKEVKDRHD